MNAMDDLIVKWKKLQVKNEQLLKEMKKIEEEIYNYGQPIHWEEFYNDMLVEGETIYGNLKMGILKDVYKEWMEKKYPMIDPQIKLLRQYIEIKHGLYPKRGWNTICLKEDYYVDD